MKTIVKLGRRYVEWSSIDDAPVTVGMTREQLVVYMHREYGPEYCVDLDDRVRRADHYGTCSARGVVARCFVIGNRAGSGGRELSFEDLVTLYDGGSRDGAAVFVSRCDDVVRTD